MNTVRSEEKAASFLKNGLKLKRKHQTYEKTFSHGPDVVFYQFCPSRECDWIDGWDCDLIYTSSGYVEKDCIFSTPETNVLGPGLWIFTRYEPNKHLELVRIIGDSLAIHFRIHLEDNHDGTSTGVWSLTFTALNEEGNAMVDGMPDENPELAKAVDGLEYFLNTGEMLK